MLLEEALAVGGGGGVNDPLISPHDEALAILSFVRDELPAGGTQAEKRFVRLVPLIADRVFGAWNIGYGAAGAGGSPGGGGASPGARMTSTSPGGSTYSSPIGVGAGATAGGTGGVAGANGRDYRHADGGWLGLASPPRGGYGHGGNGNGGDNNSSPSTASPSRTPPPAQQQQQPLERDPIVRLLRAPPTRGGGEPTLIDALSAESSRRPSVQFTLPLAALMSAATGARTVPGAEGDDGWTACLRDELEREAGEGGGGSADVTGLAPSGRTTTTWGGKENANVARILLHLLTAGPRDQLDLRSYAHRTCHQRPQQGPGPRHSPLKPQSPLMNRRIGNVNAGYRTPNNGGGGGIGGAHHHPDEGPSLALTMLEYYLFLFVRFPLANTVWAEQSEDLRRRQTGYQRQQNQHVGMRRSSMPPPYGQRVYSHLYSGYLNYYLGQGREYDTGRLGVGQNCFDHVAVVSDDDPSSAVGPSSRTSELFLRLIIELWIDSGGSGGVTSSSTEDAASRYRRLRGHAPPSSPDTPLPRPSLRDSLELAQPLSSRRRYEPPPPRAQICVLALARHLVSDMSVKELVAGVSGSVQRRQREERGGSGAAANAPPSPLVDDGNARGRGSAASPGQDEGRAVSSDWCLPPAMTATQPSMFNYVRLGLACGAIHDRSSVFHRALETWLVWLEPWNYVTKRRHIPLARSGSSGGAEAGGRRVGAAGEFLRNAAATVSSHAHHRPMEYYPSYVAPKPTSPSAYSSRWEAYVVSNAHFYTVPLAIFLRRARELDFSSTGEYRRSLTLVQRVLRVYCKSVVNVLNSVLNRRADAMTMSLFALHKTNMGEFCPPSDWKLVELQLDATNLLEEVFGQYQKRRAGMDFFDRMEAKLSALFDGKIGSEEAALDTLLSQVRYMVSLPLEYQVLPEEPQAARGFGLLRLLGLGQNDIPPADADTGYVNVPERGADGMLTDLGRQQIYAGLRKCDPLDVRYIGDPMLARVKSYEIPALVELTVHVSNYLNRKLGLVSDHAEVGGDGIEGDDALIKHYREMQRYEKVVFRVNLRFLADTRNTIFIAAIVWWLVSTIRGFFSN